MKLFIWLAVALFLAACEGIFADPISATDVDDRTITLNEPGQVTVVIYSNQDLQERTRKAGASVYPLQGKKGWRLIITIDLRNSFAWLAKGYSKRRVRANLDAEAKIIRPYYQENGNPNDPRPALIAFEDFDGKLCHALGFEASDKKLAVVIFNAKGEVARRWKDLTDISELPRELTGLLPAAITR